MFEQMVSNQHLLVGTQLPKLSRRLYRLTDGELTVFSFIVGCAEAPMTIRFFETRSTMFTRIRNTESRIGRLNKEKKRKNKQTNQQTQSKTEQNKIETVILL